REASVAGGEVVALANSLSALDEELSVGVGQPVVVVNWWHAVVRRLSAVDLDLSYLAYGVLRFGGRVTGSAVRLTFRVLLR
ncbi:MAG: hypothetical protein M0Z94_18510, partial [Dehalococcoidales bacterium]|nr:hypothetical protein [Dehalococcoidales bacterium]